MFVKVPKLAMLACVMCLASAACFAADAPSKSAGPAAKSQTAPHHVVHHSGKKTRKARVRGQKAIDGDRVRAIQQALVREHYLKGQPSGTWDDATQAAMHRYQADQGWQSKTVPDSRALIRLGLGPDHERLLNPESAMITGPSARSSVKIVSKPARTQASGSVGTPATITSMPASSTPVSAPSIDLSGTPAQ